MAEYQLGARLGGGGMAEVFEGTMRGAEGFARRVAIKRVLPGYSNNPAFAKMFVEEAQLSSKLAHPNIVSVLDFDRDAKGQLFLAMELVEGVDLHALAATGLLPFPVVIHVIAEVLRGLGYAHEVPLVHRDVSPHNVLISWGGEVKVSDFGIAKARDATTATASEVLKGKPAYMSPEQANGEALDGRSDLFAVGVMMWELLTGRRLFAADDMRATLAAVLFGKIPRPRKLRPEVPKDLERVVMRLLERELRARYRDAEQVLGELRECGDAAESGRDLLGEALGERFAREVPTQVHRSVPTGASVSSPESGTLPSGASTRARPLRRVLLLLVIAGAGIGGYGAAPQESAAVSADAASVARDGGADAHAGPNTSRKRLLDPADLPEICSNYVAWLQKLSECAFLSSTEHDRWVKALEALREGLADIKSVRKLTSIETGCTYWRNKLLQLNIDPRCPLPIASDVATPFL